MKLNIIIPTYNRKDILKKCLKALLDQTFPRSDYEIIVIDDGSKDGTEVMFKSIINSFSGVLRYFKQDHKGPAAARNVGIKNANGKIILFIGDDIIATPTLLEEHIKWHGQHPEDNVAVLGYVTWSPEIKITPFMRWLENGGPQFHFWQIEDKVEVDAQNYFYTSNISIKKEFLLKNNEFFDEEFPFPAFEDIELGYRLKQRGLKIIYNKDAVGYHYHYTSLTNTCNRMERVGEASIIYSSKVGGSKKILSSQKTFSAKRFIQKVFYPAAVLISKIIAAIFEKKKSLPMVYSFVLKGYSRKGAEIAKKRRSLSK